MTRDEQIARLERSIRELEATVQERRSRARVYGDLLGEEYQAVADRHRAELARLKAEVAS